MPEKREQVAPGAEQATEEQPSLLEEIVEITKLTDELKPLAKKGVKELITKLIEPGKKVEKVSKADVDEMIAEIDNKLSLQLDAILHNSDYQKLESAWRSLKYLIEETDFRENNRISLLNVNKDDLLEDFEEEMDITRTGLYQTVYTKEYGQFGGKPYAAMIGNYEFGPGPQDLTLLQKVASVAAMAHAPFIAAAGPAFFGIDDYNGLEKLKDLEAKFEGPEYIKWRSFRDSEDARYVSLTMPRFSLRLPYGPETLQVKAFNYEENVSASHEHYLWGNTAFAFATRLTDSFAKYRWCANIIGPMGGGAVEDLPVHQYKEMGEIQTKPPTEVLIPDRRDFELSEQGFISLCMPAWALVWRRNCLGKRHLSNLVGIHENERTSQPRGPSHRVVEDCNVEVLEKRCGVSFPFPPQKSLTVEPFVIPFDLLQLEEG